MYYILFLRYLFFGGVVLNKKIKDSDVEKLLKVINILQKIIIISKF